MKNHKNDPPEEDDDKQDINEICNSKDFKECRKLFEKSYQFDFEMMPVNQVSHLLKDYKVDKFCDTKFPPTFDSIYGDLR